MIERRVKRRRLSIRPARNLDLRQLLVPRRLRIRPNLVKIPTGKLGGKILAGTFDRDWREGDFDKDLLTRLDVEIEIKNYISALENTPIKLLPSRKTIEWL